MIAERVTRLRFSPARPAAGLGRSSLELITSWAVRIGLPLTGLIGLGLFWQAISTFVADDLPAPLATWKVFWELVSNPFYDAGPNDKGIGLQLFASLQRVAIGFSVATLIAVPIGVLIGVNPLLRRALDPLIQLLRPVSPLAWFPIGLIVFQSTNDAAVYVICITSLWPTIINTAFGAGSVPQAHRNIARVFEFSQWQYFYRVVLPYSLPHILTGMRLSMGTAWVVIVAAEMLSGGTGIGFFVWDSWNSLSLERVISAIILIGFVGLILDRGFGYAAARFSYGESS